MNICQIKTDNSFVQYGASSAPDLQELQHFVGGFIQCLPVRYQEKMQVMVINEEGKVNGLPINEIATDIFRLTYTDSTDFIVGNAWIVENLE